MTAPQGSYATNFGRFYAHPSSGDLRSLSAMGAQALAEMPEGPYSPKPSITNIIGMKNKDFLPPYYAKLVAEYAIQNLDIVSDTARRFGPQVATGVLKAIPNAPNPASAIGDEVHSAIEAHAKGLDYPGLTTITAQRMFAQYLYFRTQYPVKVLYSEFTVWSYQYGYAGTGDLMWETDKGLSIVDAKSGSNVYPEVAMQCSALANADVIIDIDGNEHSMPRVDSLEVLHVRPMSVKLHRLDRAKEAFQAFLACKELFDWQRFDREHVLQEPFKTEKPKDAK